MKNTKSSLNILFYLILAATLINGCISTHSIKPEASIEKRVHALMTSKVKGDWNRAYTFYDKKYRNKISKERFVGPQKIQVLNYNIESIQMNPDSTKAKVLVRYSMILSFGIKVDKAKDVQNWIIEDGNWYLAAKPVLHLAD